MRDYVNTSDLTSTNSQIAKFCLDHPDLIHTCSLNKLSDVSYFSQPTLSRFFQHVCGLSFNDYAKKDLEQTHEVKKIVFSFLTPSTNEQIITLRNLIGFSQKNLDTIIYRLTHSRRILVTGPTFFQSYTHSLGTVLLSCNKTLYAPYDYAAQEFLINDMGKEDIIFIHSFFKEWEYSNQMYHYEKLLSHSNVTKFVICLKETVPEYNFHYQSIVLENGNNALGDVQLLSFYKILMFCFVNCYEMTFVKKNI